MTPESIAACRTLFVGAVEEGRRCLEALLRAGEPFAGIVTLKEEWARETSGAVPFDEIAARHGVPLLKVRDLNHPANVEKVRDLRPDLILVIGWTRLVGREILSIPRLGAVGFHASLLPRYRGRAPVNWAIINGEVETGNTMFFLDGGVDTGDVIAQSRIPIDDDDTCATLYAKVAEAAIVMLGENMPLLKAGRAPRLPQDPAKATVMPKRTPEDGLIDWRRDAASLDRWVRALTHPYPGAFTEAAGSRLLVWTARPASGSAGAEPGEILDIVPGGIVVGTGSRGALRIGNAQVQGESEETADRIAAGRGWRRGTRLGSATAAIPGGGSA